MKDNSNEDMEIIPQVFGGGRGIKTNETRSLLVNMQELNHSKCLYSLDISPSGDSFIVSAGDGNVRHYDFRKIKNYKDYLNIFGNFDVNPKCDATGCSFSYDGKEVVSTLLNNYIYLYDVNKNYLSEENKSINEENEEIENEEDIERNVEAEENEDMIEVELEDEEGTRIKIPLSSFGEYFGNTRASNEKTYNNKSSSFEKCFKGHVSRETIKGVYFFGSKSEYIISGKINL
jgi:WD40 repeat protein